MVRQTFQFFNCEGHWPKVHTIYLYLYLVCDHLELDMELSNPQSGNAMAMTYQ